MDGFFSNGAIEASWTTFMEQVEHCLELPWLNLPQVKKMFGFFQMAVI